MWLNHLKLALRNFRKNQIFTLINILGLSIGMASAIMVLLWVQNEYSFDRYYQNSKDIYRTICHWNGSGETIDINAIPIRLQKEAEIQIPEIEEFYTVRPAFNFPILETSNGKKYEENALAYISDNWLKAFSYEAIEGSFADFQSDKYGVALTEDQAIRCFGDASPIGQEVKIYNQIFTVRAVLKNNPSNSSFQFKTLLPLASFWDNQEDYENDYNSGNYNYFSFFKAAPGLNQASVDKKLSKLLQEMEDRSVNSVSTIPLHEMRFHQGILSDVFQHQKPSTVNIFALIGFLILLTAGLNYINLSTALIGKRVKEIGVKKVIGASTKTVFFQIMSETVLLSLGAFLLALVVVHYFLPLLSSFIGIEIELRFSSLSLWLVLLSVIGLSIAIAGIYPALISARFKPIQLIRAKGKAQKGVSLRKVLVVTQFASVIVVLISTMVIFQQLEYIQKKDVGYERAQVMRINPLLFQIGDWRENYDNFILYKKELEKLPVFEAVAMTDNPISNISNRNSGGLSWEGKPEEEIINVAQFRANDDLQNLFDLKMSSGRWFDPNLNSDENNLILNETAIRRFNIPEPVLGRKTRFQGREGQIIGVVKDFHFASMREEIEPLVIWHNDDRGTNIMARFQGDNAQEAVQQARATFAKVLPNLNFKYSFLDENFQRLHEEDQKMSTLFQIFVSLLIFISCLGLLGLAVFAADRRVKEIGVRKVLGASVSSIVTLLSKDFLKLVVIAFVIAVPIAWYGMQKWLSNFAFHQPLQWWVFAMAGGLAIGIALLTLSPLSFRAARANPVESLRNE